MVGFACFVEEFEGTGGGRSGGVDDAGEVSSCDGFDVRELGCRIEFVVYGGVCAHAFDELEVG